MNTISDQIEGKRSHEPIYKIMPDDTTSSPVKYSICFHMTVNNFDRRFVIMEGSRSAYQRQRQRAKVPYGPSTAYARTLVGRLRSDFLNIYNRTHNYTL